MSKYSLYFDPDALKEWKRLDASIKSEFKKKALAKRLENPIIESARLAGDLNNCFKIKSNNSGYRLVYTIDKGKLIVIVIAIGKRERMIAYKSALSRLGRN